ncbi:MAG: alpha/beta hydrolase [Ruminococcus sp.]|nr:alpha/beta hydrolase [Ruminococcus sp.]
MRFDQQDKVVRAPDALNSPLYKLTKTAVKAAKLRNNLVGTKEEVLAKAAKMNAKNRHFVMPTDNKAHYTDHLIQEQYHCLEINIEKKRRKNAILFVFGGGMILGSDKGDVGLSRKIASTANADVWFPYYPLCHEHDMLENVQMIFECYAKMLTFYKPENTVFLGFSSGGALILDLVTYINELNDSGSSIPMPGLLIPVSPGSVPVTEAEKAAIKGLDKGDIIIPAEYMYKARDIMCRGKAIPEKYLATAHGDFRYAPMTHFYFGSAETLYAFAPSYAESFRKAGAKCVIHVGKGMHHCYALQYFIPGCKPAFNEVMELMIGYFRKGER